MPRGLAITLEVLRTTTNCAATSALVAGLGVSKQSIREDVLAALIGRHDEAATLEVLRRWPALADRWKAQVADRPGWLSSAIHSAIQIRDASLYAAACQAAIDTHDFDQIPQLVAAAEDAANRDGSLAAMATLELAEGLADALGGPRDYRQRRDPQLQRQHVLASLERSAAEFNRHRHQPLLEAFLLLAGRENAVLKRCLQSPGDRNFKPLVTTLEESTRQSVIRLLLSYLDDPHAPLAALQIIARRHDITFVRHFLRKVGADPAPVVRGNLKRIDSIAWLHENFQMLDALSDADQPGVAALAAASNLPRARALQTVAYLLRHGKAAGRRVAARTLAEFEGPEADNLALQALGDEDPLVRAAIAEQLRGRNVPGAVNRLIQLLDSRHEAERKAAEGSLSEFRFTRYLAAFDSLTPEARFTTGLLVKRIDAQSLPLLREELLAESRGRRKRGLEIAASFAAADELTDALAVVLNDPDPFLRVEAVRVLAMDDSPQIRDLLRTALLDDSPLVQDAAELALRTLAGGRLTERVPAATSDTTLFLPQLTAIAASVPVPAEVG
jgi:HEAT repeat protein